MVIYVSRAITNYVFIDFLLFFLSFEIGIASAIVIFKWQNVSFFNTCIHLPNWTVLYERIAGWGLRQMWWNPILFVWNTRIIYILAYVLVIRLFLDRGGGPRVVVSTAAFHARLRGSVPGLGGLKETKMFLPHPRVKASIVGSLRDREVACSASDHQGSNFEFCVCRTVSYQSSHHPQEVLLAQFSLYVHKGGLKPDSFPFYFSIASRSRNIWMISMEYPERSGKWVLETELSKNGLQRALQIFTDLDLQILYGWQTAYVLNRHLL